MFLDEFEKYNSEYEKGIKKISYRSSRPKLLKEPIDITIEQSPGNYELFFHHDGRLLHCIHKENRNNSKIIFTYNRKGLLGCILKLDSENNELLSLSEFVYDSNGKIFTEISRSFNFNSDTELFSKCIHSYHESTHEMLMSSNDGYEDCTFYFTHDERQIVIEEKVIRDKMELVYWNKHEYNEQNKLIRKISLDENGEPDGIYDFLPYINGFSSGYIYKSNDKNYKKEYDYTFNEKGHWINQVVMNDGIPIYYYERAIEYY